MDETPDIVTIIDTEYMALFYHPDHNIIHHEIRQRIPAGEFPRLLETGLKYLIKYKSKKWLSDDRCLYRLSPEDNEWGDNVWSPRMIEAGFRYWAVVCPPKGLGKIQVKRFAQENEERGVTAKVFDDYSQAFQWLISQ